MHGLSVLPPWGHVRVLRRPMHRTDNPVSWHGIGADQTLVARMEQDNPVQDHGGVAIVGELLQSECPWLATGRADRTSRNWIVDAVAAAKRAISCRTAPTTPAHGRCQRQDDQC